MPVFELGQPDDRRLFYSMPVVRGETLHDVIEALRAGRPEVLKRWPLTRRVQAFLQACQAIAYAHEKSDVLVAVLQRDPVPPRQAAPERDIPLALEAACMKALEKRLSRRHQSVQELADDVQSWLDAESDRVRRRQLADATVSEARAAIELADARDTGGETRISVLTAKVRLLHAESDLDGARAALAEAQALVEQLHWRPDGMRCRELAKLRALLDGTAERPLG